MKTFLEHIQNSVGCAYPLATILYNLEEEDILEEIEDYVKLRIDEALKKQEL